MQCESEPAKKQSAAGFCGDLLSRQGRQKTFLMRVKGWSLERGRHTAFSKRLSENDHHRRQQIDSFRPGDGGSVEIVYLCHSGRGGGRVRVEGREQVGLREREDNKWKPARSTLKVRKTLYSLLKNISICGICVLFLVCW